MNLPRPTRSRRVSRRFGPRARCPGFGAVISAEIVLLRMLNSLPTDDHVADQREVVAGVIAALRGCLQRLPAPGRFEYLDGALRHARSKNDPRGGLPTKEVVMRANAELARKLGDAHAPSVDRQEWETVLGHATAAHREMASAVQWKRIPR